MVRVYTFERASIYMDVTFISVNYYKIYNDDAGNTGKSKNEADERMKSIADQDEDGLLRWEMDYPSEREKYTAFLRSEIRISDSGLVESRLYQKEYSKNITLHKKSHHPSQTKIATIRMWIISHQMKRIYNISAFG